MQGNPTQLSARSIVLFGENLCINTSINNTRLMAVTSLSRAMPKATSFCIVNESSSCRSSDGICIFLNQSTILDHTATSF
ncbi:uncharacterized protein J3R85_015540 [Psidium guajava]|nr:uncharacterized protein J3R85_015540 [Psidium guajava]